MVGSRAAGPPTRKPVAPTGGDARCPPTQGAAMKIWGRHCLTWSGHQLFRHGVRAPVAQIEPDATYPAMWRFRLLPDGALSDMVNLAWAKDAAAALVFAGLNETEESGTGRPRMRVRRTPLPRRLSAGRPLCGRVGERL